MHRDMRRVGRDRQRMACLLGDDGLRPEVDHRLVVGAGDGDGDGLRGRSAVIVEQLDLVGQRQRLVLGEKIEVAIGVAECPFELARSVAVALDHRRHRAVEMRERSRRNDRAARHHGGFQRRARRVRVAVIAVGEIHRARQSVQGAGAGGVGVLAEAAGCVGGRDRRIVVGHSANSPRKSSPPKCDCTIRVLTA